MRKRMVVDFTAEPWASDGEERTIHVNIDSQDELLTELRGRMVRHEGFAVATLNLDHVDRLAGDDRFYSAYRQHDFVTADGFPVMLIGRMRKGHVERVTGADLVRPLVAEAADVGCPVAFVGSTLGSLRKAIAVLKYETPQLRVVHHESPMIGYQPDADDTACLIERVAASGARLCFLAFGAPKQELIAARGRLLAPDIGFVSVGAAIDFISGRQRRAPEVMRKFWLEWLWRLSQSPSRLGVRYLRCLGILPGLAMHSLSGRPH